MPVWNQRAKAQLDFGSRGSERRQDDEWVDESIVRPFHPVGMEYQMVSDPNGIKAHLFGPPGSSNDPVSIGFRAEVRQEQTIFCSHDVNPSPGNNFEIGRILHLKSEIRDLKLGTVTVAALYERRQSSKLEIVGGHRPPLQFQTAPYLNWTASPKSNFEISDLKCRIHPISKLSSRRACQPAAARLAHHFPILENELPAHQRVYRQPAHFPAGIRGPATFAENLLIRDDMLFIEVGGDQVCIRSHANGALARVQTKQLCRLGRNDLHRALERDPACTNVRQQQR